MRFFHAADIAGSLLPDAVAGCIHRRLFVYALCFSLFFVFCHFIPAHAADRSWADSYFEPGTIECDIFSGHSGGLKTGSFALSHDNIPSHITLETHTPDIESTFLNRVNAELAFELQAAQKSIKDLHTMGEGYLILIASIDKPLDEQLRALKNRLAQKKVAGQQPLIFP